MGGVECPTPCNVLHGLCTAIVRCMEPWEPPALARNAIYHSLSAVSDLWVVRHCVMFGDAVLDAIRYRGGGGAFIPKLSGIRSQVIPPEMHTQQSAELWVLVWLVRLAVRLPAVLQQADPPSRLDSNHQSSVQRACSQPYRLWRVLLFFFLTASTCSGADVPQ